MTSARTESSLVTERASQSGNIRPPYGFSYSDDVIITDKAFYGSVPVMVEMVKRGELPPDTRFLLQSEGYAMEQSSIRQGIDPRNASAFRDYFAKNKVMRYVRELTLTAYRTQSGWENGRKDTNGKYPRILIEADPKVLAEILASDDFDWRDVGDRLNIPICDIWLPGGIGDVIVESDDFGNPVETRKISCPHKGYYTHFRFSPNPPRDPISGHYDVAVERRGCWRRGMDEGCLDVVASYGRLDALLDSGFRPVLGSVPEI